MIVEAEIRAGAVRVLQGAGQLHQEALRLRNVGGFRSHVKLATLNALADCPVQSYSGQKLQLLRGLDFPGRSLPSPRGLWPDLESGLVHVDDPVSSTLFLEAT